MWRIRSAVALRDLAGADLLEWIEDVGSASSDNVFRGRDAVHFDMHPGKVLPAPVTDQVAGVVDWTGARVGDCAFDLVTLVFACQHMNVDGSMISMAEDCLMERTSADQRRAYYAHMSLRMIDWAIRHFDASEIETWINIAEHWRTRAESTS